MGMHCLRVCFDAFLSPPLARDRVFLMAAMLLMLATMEAAAAAAESKQIMLLHSFGKEFKPWSEYAQTIREELKRQSPWPIDITEQSLITARSSDEDPETCSLSISVHCLPSDHLI